MKSYLMYSDSFDPYLNLARESALAAKIKEGDIALYLWQNSNTVVIGRNQNAWRECRCALLEEEGGRVARRETGGGAVFHDLGNLNFTFVASPELYCLESQLNLIISALKHAGINAEISGRNDMTADGRKFSGCAFKHTKTYSMQHGTLLVNADMEKLSRYLTPSKAKMRAKGVESVRARVCNLSDLAPQLTVNMLKMLIAREFAERFGEPALIDPETLDTEETRARNASWEWNFGATPAFDISLETRFPWGGLEILLSLESGRVKTASVYTDAMDETLALKIVSALEGREYSPSLPLALDFLPDVRDWLAESLPL